MYFQHLSCLEILPEVSLNSPLGEAHNEESFALVQACDAAKSGFHTPPVSVMERKQEKESLVFSCLWCLTAMKNDYFIQLEECTGAS